MSKKDKIALEAYNQMAEDYLKYIDTKPYNAYYERPGLLSLLPDLEGKTVLDAGCAAGWYTKWFFDNGAKVTAIDFSPKMVEMAKLRVGTNAKIINADLNQPLDFITDQAFDLVVSSLTLHYLKDWNPVMKEFHRILKPDGVLVFSVHHPFMDFAHFKRENYFALELLEDQWTMMHGEITVQFYRRPLHQIIAPVIQNGFIIDNLIEPMPTAEFKEANPKDYEKLTKKPQFLFIRCQKVCDSI